MYLLLLFLFISTPIPLNRFTCYHTFLYILLYDQSFHLLQERINLFSSQQQAIQRSCYKADQNANRRNVLYVFALIHHRMNLIYLLLLFFFASFFSFCNFAFSAICITLHSTLHMNNLTIYQILSSYDNNILEKNLLHIQ